MSLLQILIDNYGTDTLVTLENEGNRTINHRGLKKVASVIGMSPDNLPRGFDKRVVSPSGKFSTRLGAWVHAWEGQKLTPEQLAEIGGIAEANSTPADVIHFDITPEIMTWRTGTFRDPGSCLRGGYHYHCENLRRLGGYTLRVFSPGGGPHNAFYDTYKGEGRAFIMPVNGTDIMMFNYYGFGGSGEKFGGVLVEALARIDVKAELFMIDDLNKGSGIMYFNESSPWAVGRAGEDHKQSVSIKLKAKVSQYSCSVCGKNNIYEKSSETRRMCPECGDRCYSCENWYHAHKMRYVHMKNGKHRFYCTSCHVDYDTLPCGRLSVGWECECEVCNEQRKS